VPLSTVPTAAASAGLAEAPVYGANQGGIWILTAPGQRPFGAKHHVERVDVLLQRGRKRAHGCVVTNTSISPT